MLHSSSTASPAGRKIFQRDTVFLYLALRLLRHGLQETGIFPGILCWEDKPRDLVPVMGWGLGGGGRRRPCNNLARQLRHWQVHLTLTSTALLDVLMISTAARASCPILERNFRSGGWSIAEHLCSSQCGHFHQINSFLLITVIFGIVRKDYQSLACSGSQGLGSDPSNTRNAPQRLAGTA